MLSFGPLVFIAHSLTVWQQFCPQHKERRNGSKVTVIEKRDTGYVVLVDEFGYSRGISKNIMKV